jgi:sigma-B regulation protein RsbU (phosphoserine phosphatase)
LLFRTIEGAASDKVVPIRKAGAGSFDPDGLLRRAGGDWSLAREVINMFLEDTPEVLSQMLDAIGRKDWKAVERGAHRIKGAAANLDASDLANIAFDIEQNASDRTRRSAAERHGRVENDVANPDAFNSRMKVLIADDDPVSRRLLQASLEKWGYDANVLADGAAAWESMQDTQPPQLLILDWLMPHVDGLELCRRARTMKSLQSAYIILLTSRATKSDIVKGLESGADDYITKPFDPGELRARVQVGKRVIDLQTALAERLRHLEEAMARVNQLQGLLPICCYCKKVRDDKNYWHQVENYVARHVDVRFSHGVCPDCMEQLRKDLSLPPRGEQAA